MKVCKTIQTGQHSFLVYAFDANFFDVIFFRENGFCETMCHSTKHFVSGYLASGEKCPNDKSFGASGSWAEPCFACPTLRCGGFAYPPGILEDVLTCEIKEKRILGSIPYNWITAKI